MGMFNVKMENAGMMFEVENVSDDVKDIVERLDEHYMNCYRVGCMMFDAKCGEPRSINLDCCDAMRQDNVRTGIEWCCIARENGIDAMVDMLWGYVIPSSKADKEAMIDDKKRYLTFEFVDEE